MRCIAEVSGIALDFTNPSLKVVQGVQGVKVSFSFMRVTFSGDMVHCFKSVMTDTDLRWRFRLFPTRGSVILSSFWATRPFNTGLGSSSPFKKWWRVLLCQATMWVTPTPSSFLTYIWWWGVDCMPLTVKWCLLVCGLPYISVVG